jgi:hypothetical protein
MTQVSSNKIDWKKENKDLYFPKDKPVLINVPSMQFIMIDGKGDPKNDEYQQAVSQLYNIVYTIKMKGKHLPGYFNYSVPPLESLWWEKDDSFDLHSREKWNWIAMIRQYDFVTQDVFTWALEIAKQKNPDLDFSKARLETFTEGLCVQIMHTGPYADEPATVEKIHTFIAENNLKSAIGKDRKHHELYITSPLKTSLEKLKTVLRNPVEKM